MEALIGGLVTLYVVFSVVSALLKRAAHEPGPGEFGETEPPSPYGPGWEPVEVPAQEQWFPDEPAPRADDFVQERMPDVPSPAVTLPAVETEVEAAPDGELADGGDAAGMPFPLPSKPLAGSQAAVRRLLSTLEGRRQAVLLAEVLGPPRALRPWSGRRP